MSKNDGGPAFPIVRHYNDSSGMSLRDYFAGQALAGLMANDGKERWCQQHEEEIGLKKIAQFHARLAYDVADAMIKERSK